MRRKQTNKQKEKAQIWKKSQIPKAFFEGPGASDENQHMVQFGLNQKAQWEKMFDSEKQLSRTPGLKYTQPVSNCRIPVKITPGQLKIYRDVRVFKGRPQVKSPVTMPGHGGYFYQGRGHQGYPQPH